MDAIAAGAIEESCWKNAWQTCFTCWSLEKWRQYLLQVLFKIKCLKISPVIVTVFTSDHTLD
jgi:hypothetical protein